MKKNVGEKLQQLRRKLNISQKSVADSIGVSVSAIAMYETNERTPRDEVKVKLSNFYKVSVQDIFF